MVEGAPDGSQILIRRILGDKLLLNQLLDPDVGSEAANEAGIRIKMMDDTTVTSLTKRLINGVSRETTFWNTDRQEAALVLLRQVPLLRVAPANLQTIYEQAVNSSTKDSSLILADVETIISPYLEDNSEATGEEETPEAWHRQTETAVVWEERLPVSAMETLIVDEYMLSNISSQPRKTSSVVASGQTKRITGSTDEKNSVDLTKQKPHVTPTLSKPKSVDSRNANRVFKEPKPKAVIRKDSQVSKEASKRQERIAVLWGQGKSAAEIIDMVHEEFGVRYAPSTVYVYLTNMRADGKELEKRGNKRSEVVIAQHARIATLWEQDITTQEIAKIIAQEFNVKFSSEKVNTIVGRMRNNGAELTKRRVKEYEVVAKRRVRMCELWRQELSVPEIVRIMAKEFGEDFTAKSLAREVHFMREQGVELKKRKAGRQTSKTTVQRRVRIAALWKQNTSAQEIAQKIAEEFGIAFDERRVSQEVYLMREQGVNLDKRMLGGKSSEVVTKRRKRVVALSTQGLPTYKIAKIIAEEFKIKFNKQQVNKDLYLMRGQKETVNNPSTMINRFQIKKRFGLGNAIINSFVLKDLQPLTEKGRLVYNLDVVIARVQEYQNLPTIDGKTGTYTDSSGEIWSLVMPAAKLLQTDYRSVNKLCVEAETCNVKGSKGEVLTVHKVSDLRRTLEQWREEYSVQKSERRREQAIRQRALLLRKDL